MEHLAHRCATVAAAALAVGGLIAALTPMTQSPPDLQIRDFELVGLPSANVDANSMIETMENHFRTDLSGGESELQQMNHLLEALLGSGNGDVGDGSTFNAGDLDQSAVSELLGGGFDPQGMVGVVPPDVDLGGVVPPTAGVFGGTEQAAGTAAASAVTGIAVALQDLPVAYQAFTAAVAAIESDLNSSLVTAQMNAAEQLFGDNPEVNEVVNWIYSVNNTLLAQNESAFNSLFGIPFDAHSSLLGHLDPGLADADWNVLLGLTPDDFNDIVQALQADNMSLLGSIDWASWFSGLF